MFEIELHRAQHNWCVIKWDHIRGSVECIESFKIYSPVLVSMTEPRDANIVQEATDVVS